MATVPHPPEALIIGGGLAGASVATHLARANRDVTLFEQQAGPHDKVCGEFLSHEAVHYLGLLGVDPVSLGAVPINHVRFAIGRAVVERRLPFTALSITRRTLDEALLRTAAGAGVRVVRQRVQSLTRLASSWTATTAEGSVSAPTAFLATGKHDLLGHPRPPGRQNDLIGIKMYLRLAPPELGEQQGHVDLVTFPGGYAGLQPVEDGIANLCCLIQGDLYRRLGGTWAALLSHMAAANPHLARRVEGATPVLDRPLAIARIPYGMLRGQAGGEALWLLGDQAAVIPSFSGDGMSIALHTAHTAAAAYLRGDTPAGFARMLHGQLRRQVHIATLVSRALVSPALRPFIRAAVSTCPGILPLLARSTRIPPQAIARA